MVYPKVQSAAHAALQSFSQHSNFDAMPLATNINEVLGAEKDFMKKIELLDEIFDNNPQIEELREVFFDLLLINFFSADVTKLEADYLDSPEWAKIEDETIDRGTELLNLLLYLNECADEGIEPELDDYLKEFLLVDEDEFQDEYRIYEPVIANQILMESPIAEIKKVAVKLPEDAEIKELFYPMMAYFQNVEPNEATRKAAADNAVEVTFDAPVYEILVNFK